MQQKVRNTISILGALGFTLLLGTLVGFALPMPDGQITLTRNQCLKENCDPKPSTKVYGEMPLAGNDTKTLDGCERMT